MVICAFNATSIRYRPSGSKDSEDTDADLAWFLKGLLFLFYCMFDCCLLMMMTSTSFAHDPLDTELLRIPKRSHNVFLNASLNVSRNSKSLNISPNVCAAWHLSTFPVSSFPKNRITILWTQPDGRHGRLGILWHLCVGLVEFWTKNVRDKKENAHAESARCFPTGNQTFVGILVCSTLFCHHFAFVSTDSQERKRGKGKNTSLLEWEH